MLIARKNHLHNHALALQNSVADTGTSIFALTVNVGTKGAVSAGGTGLEHTGELELALQLRTALAKRPQLTVYSETLALISAAQSRVHDVPALARSEEREANLVVVGVGIDVGL